MAKLKAKKTFIDESKGDVEEYLHFYKDINFKPIVQTIPKEVRTISFILPGMLSPSGGRTSVLILGTFLSRQGYKVNYVSFKPQDLEEMKRNAEKNLPDYEGEMYDMSALETLKSDVWVATFWESAYVAKKLDGYKMYFVQDYEPYFYDYGDQYLMAKATYDLGLHIVSLGSWNKMMVEKHCNPKAPVDFIDFPYDGARYKNVERDFSKYKNKKELNLAVYVKPTARRAPIITQIMMAQLTERFQNDGITLNVNYFGSEKDAYLLGGNNIGKLSIKELFELYKKSDFGMVASMSNLSLIPYEMMATQLPVIEFKEGTLPHFVEPNSAILTSIDYEDLYNQLKYYLEHTDKLEKMVKRAKSQLKSLSWSESAKQFSKILTKASKSFSKINYRTTKSVSKVNSNATKSFPKTNSEELICCK